MWILFDRITIYLHNYLFVPHSTVLANAVEN